jgi:cytosine/adenosine deaminase-related metal-dependent hydrolase
MTRAFPGMLFHTHASENRVEMDAVRARCGMDNIEYFEHLGILHANTCLAHCIWLNDVEVQLMRERRANVLHCPSSNLKLGSGIANIPRYLSSGIGVSLGADGAPCNNSLNMFQEMRLAALMQKPLHGPAAMPALTVLRMATLGGAQALGLGDETGSIEPGKRADVQILDTALLPAAPTGTGTAHPATTIVYSCGAENVVAVMANGAWLYREGRHTTIDVPRSMDNARRELVSLLSRVQRT